MKLIPLRYDGSCRKCRTKLQKGTQAYYGKIGGVGRVECQTCYAGSATSSSSAGSTSGPVIGVSTPDCANCPSFVMQSDTKDVFKRDTGADMCFRHMTVLSRQSYTPSQNEQLRQEVAGKCADFSKVRPASADLQPTWVALPDPTVSPRPVGASNQAPSGCTGCEHFVPISVVKKELGWGLAACAARGQLMFPSNYTSEAAGCPLGVSGENRDTTDGMRLMPEYDRIGQSAGASSADTRIKPATYDLDAELKRHAVDPRDYVTDKPVDPAEAHVVRAWREVRDPEGMRESVYLPIFHGEKLCGFDPRTTYGSHRPDLYVDHQGMLYDFTVELMELDETPLMQGPAGTGKTEFACYLARLMDLPFVRISVEKGTESYHLMGDKELIESPDGTGIVTSWKHGRFSENYDKPCVIVVDEPNLKSEIYEALRPCTDSAKQLVLDGAQGIIVERGPQTFLMLAQNPPDDPIYVGTEPMNAADTDRVSPFAFSLPTENMERQIIKSHCADGGYSIPNDVLDKIMLIAHDIRNQITNGDLSIAWGLRSQIKVARKTRFYSLEKAYRRAVLDGLDQDSVESVTQSVRSYS